ncbi:MAG: CcmD family protein, partial [Nitrospinaceae bacterium]|nr:CcmD family protein [Nitrospinaceae bacterium]NIR54408.1 CcmD family protein [Nitrospinaceae bacterium]NIS84822.1 CcmD family protein [Nitrospinaceae bacterium]NIT81627.1 CcmD family protein [Nitrospinaceae bacterium]NIU43910.1 CcmD family protein [Nitrospinaceae bacterium]
MDNLGFLFAANAFVWGGILVYLGTLWKRSQALQKDLELLKEVIQKE